MNSSSNITYSPILNPVYQLVDKIKNDANFRDRVVGGYNGVVTLALIGGTITQTYLDPANMLPLLTELGKELVKDLCAHGSVWVRATYGDKLTDRQKAIIDVVGIVFNLYRVFSMGQTYWSSEIPPAANTGDAVTHGFNLWWLYNKFTNDYSKTESSQEKVKKT